MQPSFIETTIAVLKREVLEMWYLNLRAERDELRTENERLVKCMQLQSAELRNLRLWREAAERCH